jgi:transcriptional regulator with XRE-family HTH domain
MDKETFGQRLKRFREAAGLSQRQLAAAAGIGSHASISLAERGMGWDRIPSPEITKPLAKALRVPHHVLVGEAAEVEPLPDIQTVPLAELLKRIGARPVVGEYVEDLKLSASRKGSRIIQGFDEARPRKGGGSGSGGGKTPERIQIIEVEGRCMEDVLFPGDLVHVDTQQTPEIGKIVAAVRFFNETIVKYLCEKEGRQYFEGKDGTIVPFDQYTRILGPVKWVQRRIQ